MIQSSILEALIITAGVIITQVAISWRSQSVILYRLKELEKKQDLHNGLMVRMAVVENAVSDLKKDERC